MSRRLIIDCSHFSGTDLDMEIVGWATAVYGYPEVSLPMDDSEGWQWEADQALEFLNDEEYKNGRYFEIEDNSLFLVDGDDNE